MRILSYNILDGGANRVDLLRQVIASEQPDVIGLVEADDPGVVDALADALQMDFIHAPGSKKACALLSRLPIQSTINHALLRPRMTKSFLEAVVLDAAGDQWTFGVVHLHAHAAEKDEVVREMGIAEVLEAFRPYRQANRPHLLMGDFNAAGPYQKIEPTLCKASTQKEFYENGGHLPRRAIARLLDAGYADSLRTLHPFAAETSGSFSTESPGQRVDYIFTFGVEAMRLREARVIYRDPARQASDHYPVFVETIA